MSQKHDNSSLQNAFNAADYFVLVNGEWNLLKAGVRDSIMAQLSGGETWAIITAFNPFGQLIAEEENWKRHHRLDIMTANYMRLLAYGTGEGWPKEFGFCLMHISESEAFKLARIYEQAAILIGVDVPEVKMVPLT